MGIFGKEPEAKPAEAPPPVRPSAPVVPDKDGKGQAAAAAAGAPRPGTCVIAPKTVVKGEITGDEDIVVEGNVEGQIRISRDLRVGAGGVVKATVEANSIIVSGEVTGDCQANVRVEIQSTGRLTGNIRAPKIVIAEGAMFRGNSDMSARKDDKKVAAL
jgi:cytoskeletal protein CcmA (bactofilin family)